MILYLVEEPLGETLSVHVPRDIAHVIEEFIGDLPLPEVYVKTSLFTMDAKEQWPRRDTVIQSRQIQIPMNPWSCRGEYSQWLEPHSRLTFSTLLSTRVELVLGNRFISYYSAAFLKTRPWFAIQDGRELRLTFAWEPSDLDRIETLTIESTIELLYREGTLIPRYSS
jgi:hypothetical protein